MLREIFRQINAKDSPYYDIYYLTDTEIRFSINDDRIGRVITSSIRNENNKYIAYSFEKSKIPNSPIIRHDKKEVISIDEYWKWFNDFYNDLH